MMISVHDIVENIAEKGEIAGYQHYIFSQNAFKSFLSQGRLKSGLCGEELSPLLSEHSSFDFNKRPFITKYFIKMLQCPGG